MLIRVRNASTNAVISDYRYDPMLRQRQKAVGSTKTNFYYAGWQRLADYDGTAGTLQNRYVYGTSLDEILIQVASSGTKTYYHANNQGSIIATTNSSGAIINRYKYGPFGESVALTGTTHGYTGQRYDAETGLYYYKMRYYAPKIGRFLQPDPIGMAGGMNLYQYLANSPMKQLDPLGLYGWYEETIYIQYDPIPSTYNLAQHARIIVTYQKWDEVSGIQRTLVTYEGIPSGGGTDPNSNLVMRIQQFNNFDLLTATPHLKSLGSLTMETYDDRTWKYSSGDSIVYWQTWQLEAQAKRLKELLDVRAVPYRFLDQNSNSLAQYLLNSVHLSIPASTLWTPGMQHADFLKNTYPRLKDFIDGFKTPEQAQQAYDAALAKGLEFGSGSGQNGPIGNATGYGSK